MLPGENRCGSKEMGRGEGTQAREPYGEAVTREYEVGSVLQGEIWKHCGHTSKLRCTDGGQGLGSCSLAT